MYSATDTKIKELTYRPEIDGLRALAVGAVLLFHLNVPFISGGFSGVDIFFVISGYLITSILLRDLALGRFSLAHFYRKRALRILPPLLLVLVAIIPAAWLFLLPGEVATLGRTIPASALFYSNIFFWLQFDYFTPDAKENPLLHTWSLGVEEQFYLFVPLLLWALFRFFRLRLGWIFAITVLLSFSLSAATVASMPKATFYLLPTRYWELGAGALLAMWSGGVSGRVARIIGPVGLALLIFSVFWLTPDSVFPAWNALPPVVGAVLLIAAGHNSATGFLLSRTIMVGIGKISYSLYLWHWPVIVFYKLRFGPVLDGFEMVCLGLVSIFLAILSTRFVERPFRHLSVAVPDRRVLGLSFAALAAISVGGGMMWAFSDRWRAYPAEVVRIAEFTDYRETAEYRRQYRPDQCFITGSTSGGFAAFDKEICMSEGAGQENEVLLIGDSHAAHLSRALAETLKEYSVSQATASGCLPFPNSTGSPYCTKLINYVFSDYILRNSPDIVILSARWQLSSDWITKRDLPDFEDVVATLKAAGVKKVVILGPAVEYLSDLPKLLARDALNHSDTAGSLRKSEPIAVNDKMKKSLKGMDVDFISLLDLTCPNDKCKLMEDGVPMQFDYGHFTSAGAKAVADEIVQRLGLVDGS